MAQTAAALLPFPLAAEHWRAIVQAMGLSQRQAEVAELLARGATLQEIAATLDISVSTVRTQLDCIFAKTRATCRGELLMHILAVSHQVGYCSCRQNEEHPSRDE